MDQVHKQMGKLKVLVESDELYYSTLGNIIKEAAADAIDNDRVFTVGVSGGSVANILVETLPCLSNILNKFAFFFCDERIVPLDTADSNYGYYKTNLIKKLPELETQFIKINPDVTAEDAAKDYTKKMSLHFGTDNIPKFDMLLLGVGEDGHTCSLFPNHKLLNEEKQWVSAITNSPKPPLSRITLTLPVLNHARICIFPVRGTNKADIVKKILEEEEDLPATRVRPTHGEVIWYLDKSAAKLLKSKS